MPELLGADELSGDVTTDDELPDSRNDKSAGALATAATLAWHSQSQSFEGELSALLRPARAPVSSWGRSAKKK